MAKLIFELMQRGQPQYFKLSEFPTRIGRAFDNDIIISDSTVSPYHLMINQEDDSSFVIHNLSTENGTLLDKQWLDDSPKKLNLSQPIKLQFGHSHGRLVDSEIRVEKTHLRGCQSNFCLFDNLLWSLLLLLITILTIFWQSYLETTNNQTGLYYIGSLMPNVLIMIGIALVIAGANRLVTHRWEIAAAISLSALIFMIPSLLDPLGHFLDYFFTGEAWGNIFDTLTYFFLIPFLLSIFLIKIHHTKRLQAISVSFLLCSPLIAYHISDTVGKLSIANQFLEQPKYHNLLTSNDIRLQETLEINVFLREAETTLDEVLLKNIDKKDR